MYNSPLALKKGMLSTFWNMLKTTPESFFKDFIYRGSSSSNEEKYWIPQALPSFEEWRDLITYSDFKDSELTVNNKHYQRGLVIDRDYFADTRAVLGNQVEQFMKSLATKYAAFPDALCTLLLAANSAAFDGTAFFATSRPNLDTGSNTINNLLGGTLSTAYTTSTFAADFAAAKAAYYAMKDKNDEPFFTAPKFVVFVGTSEEDIAKRVLTTENYIDATTSVQTQNIYINNAEVRVNYRQAASDHDWYLIDLNNPTPPFVIQDRDGLKVDMKDDKFVTGKDVKYLFDFRMGYNFLNPMSIIKTNN